MTDREMLEFAAKACGLRLVFDQNGVPRNATYYAPDSNVFSMPVWNARADDGDCARMEAALGIWLRWETELVEAYVYFHNYCTDEGVYFSHHNGDRNAARRMASCMVAAQIGRDMG